ncbi:hypothetical protein LSH36_387g00026, partial [Paralvinella palmiformis]
HTQNYIKVSHLYTCTPVGNLTQKWEVSNNKAGKVGGLGPMYCGYLTTTTTTTRLMITSQGRYFHWFSCLHERIAANGQGIHNNTNKRSFDLQVGRRFVLHRKIL